LANSLLCVCGFLYLIFAGCVETRLSDRTAVRIKYRTDNSSLIRQRPAWCRCQAGLFILCSRQMLVYKVSVLNGEGSRAVSQRHCK
jgi:hypothetical protein